MAFSRYLTLPARLFQLVRSWRSDHDKSIASLPLYIWNRYQEQRLERSISERKNEVFLDRLPSVKLVLVATQAQREQLVDLYFRNPSALVGAPMTGEALRQRLASGTEYYLIYNDDDELVGARAVRFSDARIMHATIDRPFRRRGYWLASEQSLSRMLAQRGLTRLTTYAFRENTSIIRSALATGWVEENHPDDETLVRLTKFL